MIMFGRTFSFWHRLVGKPAPAVDAGAERRVWVRYPANLQTTVQLAAHPVVETRVSARVQDISPGGANLLVDQAFEAGQMLSVELPHTGAQETHTVLACIVRVVADGDSQWSLGCVFSRELTDEDLEGFGAKRVRHTPPDQRLWMRFATNREASFQKVGDPEKRTYAARIINLSASGVGLAVTSAVDAGALLSVDLRGADGRVARTILACVVHVATQPEGHWALGCNFIRELSDAEFQALI
jgi:hypothetical protein